MTTVLTRIPDAHVESAAAIEPLLRVVGRQQRVPLVDGRTVRSVYLDNAASAPALQAVADHVAAVLPYYASVHRGAGYPSQVCTQLYEDARREVADFVGARADDVVVFTRNTTDSLNLLSTAVPGEVVVLDLEHHANFLPWQRSGARVVEAQATIAGTTEALEAELARRPAALLAVTGASNVTGEGPDLVRWAALAHRYGARIAVDAAQLLPHRDVSLSASGIDYLAFSGHKLYAPYGAGALIGRRDWLDDAPPYLAGGGAVRSATSEQTTWASSPERHEAGTPNLVGVAAIAEACRALRNVGIAARRAHEIALQRELIDGLRRRNIEPLAIWSNECGVINRVGVVSFTVPGFSASQVAAYLSAEWGIGVRDGRFCAHPLLQRLTGGEPAIRVSLGVGSSTADVTRLFRALDELRLVGPRWTYTSVDGSCRPTPDPRPLPASWRGVGPLSPDRKGATPCTTHPTPNTP